MKTQLILLIFGFMLVLSSCMSDGNKHDIDVSGIDVNIEIKRLDKDLFVKNIDSVENKIPDLYKKYGDFFRLYSIKVLNLPDPASREYSQMLKHFLLDYSINKIHGEVEKQFTDLKPIKHALENAFIHYKYYFPEKKIPGVVTCISGLNQSIITNENTLAIALDKYLGADNKIYRLAQTHKYMSRKMYSEKIPVDCMFAWGYTEFPFNDSINNLMANIVYKGQLMYFVDAMLPHIHDSIKFGYTQNQYAWAIQFEKKAWEYMIGQKHLFSDDRMVIKKYIDESPFTSYFHSNSAPQIGVWIGRSIVNAYMEKNPQITLPKLMKITDYEQILNFSRYDP